MSPAVHRSCEELTTTQDQMLPMIPKDAEIEGRSSASLSADEVEAIYQRYHRDLLAFLIGVLRDGHLAHDALQLTFQKVAEQGGTARTETLRGWLFQVAYREALQLRRREQRESQVQEQFWSACRTEVEYRDPAETLVSQEILEQLKTAVHALPAEQREVVERRIRDGATFAEIAGKIGAPLGTVLTRMRLAVERLRKQLSDESHE